MSMDMNMDEPLDQNVSDTCPLTSVQQQITAASGEPWRVSAGSKARIVDNARSDNNRVLNETVFIVLGEYSGILTPADQIMTIVHGETQTPASGDIVIELTDHEAVEDTDSKEAYVIDVGNYAKITASSERAVMYGLRTLLQRLADEGSVSCGTITDSPVMPERALHIDIGRKFYSEDWLLERIREMSRLRLNTLQLHFSENEGFRLMSESHPEVVSDHYLTKQEMKAIILTAQRYHVDIIPSLDSPGHLGQALRTHPEWLLKDAAGTPAPGALDITNPAARRFVLELIDEYAELFAGSRYFHIGGDEFINFAEFDKYPQLAEYARNVLNISGGTGVDTYIDYLNEVAEHLESRGWTVRAWNDGLYRADQTQRVAPKPSIQITYWTKWHPMMAPVEDILAKGHQVINYNDGYLYYVLGENAGYKYPTGEKIRASWHPGLFPARTGEAKQEYTGAYPRELIGTTFSIWSDKPEAQTEAEVAAGLRGPLRAMAELAWLGKQDAGE
ncbi:MULTISPECIES: beta-N-acetylhexosaminidase [unclassified Paenibacillus]|uniref:beta-N-acetylhexosaminidase n=1 Tax=unclassified Paenibacillus TaxID=185978 RepID=UPI0030FC7C70